MRKIKKMVMMPRLGAIQWNRLRRDLPSRSLAPAMGTKGGGKATAILNLDYCSGTCRAGSNALGASLRTLGPNSGVSVRSIATAMSTCVNLYMYTPDYK